MIIDIPDGMCIDESESTFEKIVFKKKNETPWRDSEDHSSQMIDGYFIDSRSTIIGPIGDITQTKININVFATEKQAKSALAMAQISQIMEHDPRFGGSITDEEWHSDSVTKYIIKRYGNEIATNNCIKIYQFLAFHTLKQRDLFLNENLDLVKDYLMIE